MNIQLSAVGKDREREIASQAAVLGALPHAAALIDEHGAVAAANGQWLEAGIRLSAEVVEGIGAILRGDSDSYIHEYAVAAAGPRKWYLLRAQPLQGAPGVLVTHVETTDRKRTAEALASLSMRAERRERMLGTMLSSITDSAYTFDCEGRVLFANQPTLTLWGRTLDEAVGKSVFELGYGGDLGERVQQQIRAVFETGAEITDETTFRGHSGAVGYYEYSFTPAFGPDGSVEFGVGCTREITRRKQAEMALQQSVADFQTLAAAMPQIVWVTDAAGATISLNQQWVDYSGRGLQDSLGYAWLSALHPDDRERIAQAWRHALESRSTFTSESRLRRADGAYRWWLVRGIPLQDDAGEIVKWIGTNTDIDELKLAQMEISRSNQALQRQRTELRVLFDHVPAMIWFKDTDGRIVRVNERGARSMGSTVDAVEGRTLAEIDPDCRRDASATEQEVMLGGQPALGRVELTRDARGNELWLQTDTVPYRDESGQVIGVVVMAHDVSDRKRDRDALQELNASLENRVRQRTAELALARDEAEGANQAKSAFLATMSHEIRTPMSGLLGLLELLALSTLDADQRSTLAVARESGKALQRIIDDILDFSKIEANALELDIVPASVEAVVEAACRLHGQVASSKNLLLRTHVSPEISDCLNFDPLRVGQILNNLLNNAIKFTEQGWVEVAVDLVARTEHAEQLLFTVRDTGVGIAADQLEKLFRPFMQAATATSTRFGGTGLGLVISRRLAGLMGGAISVQSQPGQGTVMTLSVEFPVCLDGTAQELTDSHDQELLNALVHGRRRAPSVEEAHADGTLLLVVDDHPVNRMLLMRQLSSLGYAAEGAADGLHGLRAWESGRYAAIITDCNMPRMSGYELAAAIRRHELAAASGRIPIIGCTANALASAAQECLAAGMDDTLIKPVNLAEVARKLDHWLPLARVAGEQRAQPQRAPARPSLASTQGLLDLVLLSEIALGNPQVQADLIADFRRVNDEDCAVLREAVRDGRYDQAARISHRIKGACLMLGASLLAGASEAVEAAAARKDAEAVAKALEAFNMEALRLNNYLDRLAV